jgi:hypothetical protein
MLDCCSTPASSCTTTIHMWVYRWAPARPVLSPGQQLLAHPGHGRGRVLVTQIVQKSAGEATWEEAICEAVPRVLDSGAFNAAAAGEMGACSASAAATTEGARRLLLRRQQEAQRQQQRLQRYIHGAATGAGASAAKVGLLDKMGQSSVVASCLLMLGASRSCTVNTTAPMSSTHMLDVPTMPPALHQAHLLLC